MKAPAKIGIGYLARIQAIGFVLVGLVLGVLYSVGGFLFELSTGTLNTGTALAFLALLLMPLLGGAIGLVTGAITAVLYNLIAGRLGASEVEDASD